MKKRIRKVVDKLNEKSIAIYDNSNRTIYVSDKDPSLDDFGDYTTFNVFDSKEYIEQNSNYLEILERLANRGNIEILDRNEMIADLAKLVDESDDTLTFSEEQIILIRV